MSTEYKFNLNDEIAVKLRPEGFKHWHEYDNRYLGEQHRQPLSYYTAKADKDGYVKFQAWVFMEIFGQTIRFGGLSPFDLNIILTPTTPTTNE
jgi:hypothetical protein